MLPPFKGHMDEYTVEEYHNRDWEGPHMAWLEVGTELRRLNGIHWYEPLVAAHHGMGETPYLLDVMGPVGLYFHNAAPTAKLYVLTEDYFDLMHDEQMMTDLTRAFIALKAGNIPKALSLLETWVNEDYIKFKELAMS